MLSAKNPLQFLLVIFAIIVLSLKSQLVSLTEYLMYYLTKHDDSHYVVSNVLPDMCFMYLHAYVRCYSTPGFNATYFINSIL